MAPGLRQKENLFTESPLDFSFSPANASARQLLPPGGLFKSEVPFLLRDANIALEERHRQALLLIGQLQGELDAAKEQLQGGGGAGSSSCVSSFAEHRERQVAEEALHRTIDDYAQALEEKDGECARLRAELDRCEQREAQQRDKVVTLLQEFQSLAAERERMVSQLRAFRAQQQDSDCAVSSLRATNEQNLSVNAILLSRIEDLEAALQAARLQTRLLAAEKQDFAQKLEKIKSEQERAEADALNALDGQRVRISELEDEVDVLQNRARERSGFKTVSPSCPRSYDVSPIFRNRAGATTTGEHSEFSSSTPSCVQSPYLPSRRPLRHCASSVTPIPIEKSGALRFSADLRPPASLLEEGRAPSAAKDPSPRWT